MFRFWVVLTGFVLTICYGHPIQEQEISKQLSLTDDKNLVYVTDTVEKKDAPRTLDTLIDIYQGRPKLKPEAWKLEAFLKFCSSTHVLRPHMYENLCGILAGLSLLGDVMGSAKRPMAEGLRSNVQEFMRNRREQIANSQEIISTTPQAVETTTILNRGDTTTMRSIMALLKKLTTTTTTTKLPFSNNIATTEVPTTKSTSDYVISSTTQSPKILKQTFFKDIESSTEYMANFRQERDESSILSNEIEDASVEINTPPNSVKQTENQDEEDMESSEEEDPGLVGGLISTLLGGLSKPDGGVDLEALVGLIGGLSVQKDDGSFDFSGLTELLQGFLGGDATGGSDVGSFLGGVLGAVIKGLAKPPGARGAGIFAGNVLNGILPGLSAPPPPPEGEMAPPQQKPDSGGFLTGLVSTIIGGSSAGGSSGGGHIDGSAGFFTKVKQGVFKTVFRIFSSILGASSAHKQR